MMCFSLNGLQPDLALPDEVEMPYIGLRASA
jgi:hypothetical protein